MAKKAKQDETQELPPVTIETVTEAPLRTMETVEVKDAEDVTIDLDAYDESVKKVYFADGSTLEQEGMVAPPDTELTHIYNEDTGDWREVYTRAGYAPAPMPFGFRLATEVEVKAKGKQ